MHWIVLNCVVSDLSEEFDPLDDFTEHISENYSLAAPACVTPSLPDAFRLRFLGEG